MGLFSYNRAIMAMCHTCVIPDAAVTQVAVCMYQTRHKDEKLLPEVLAEQAQLTS